MAIVNTKESFLSRKRWNGNEAGSWCSYIPTTSSKNSDSNSNMMYHEGGSQRNIMSNSLPKSFQQSHNSCYSRSSSSTPISITESESDTSDMIDGSIVSSTKQYYDGKTW